LIDGRFGDGGGNRFAVSTTVSIVGDQIAIGFQIAIELVERACQLAPLETFRQALIALDWLDLRDAVMGVDALDASISSARWTPSLPVGVSSLRLILVKYRLKRTQSNLRIH
jgi:hypothetical protein